MTEQAGKRIRASDAEREQVAAVVRHAMGEGRLSLDEGEQRLAAVYATTYRDELPAFTADLPPGPPDSASGADGGPTGEPAGGRFGDPTAAAAGTAGRPRRTGPAGSPFRVAVLAFVLAGVATLWAVAGDGPVWPAIVLGGLALVWFKHRWYAHRGFGHRGFGHRGFGHRWPAMGEGEDPGGHRRRGCRAATAARG